MAKEVTQPIASIVVVWDDYERGVQGVGYSVGSNGVTEIEAFSQNGEYCEIPYVRVWAGEQALAEYNRHSLREVRFMQAAE